MFPNPKSLRQEYKPDPLVLRSATRTIVIDRRWENVEALLEKGWTTDSNPDPKSPEPTAWPILWWDQHMQGPVEPHPEYLRAINTPQKAAPEPEYVEKNYKGGEDPLMMPDLPPMPKGITSPDQFKPKADKIKAMRERTFREAQKKNAERQPTPV